MRSTSSLPLAVCVVASVGCAGVYGPIYDPRAEPHQASYDLRDEATKFGQARVIAESVADIDIGGEIRGVITVSVELNNHGGADVEVAAKQISMRYVDADGTRISGAALDIVRRNAAIVNEEVARIDAAFALPRGTSADEVTGFAVRWAFEREGESYEEVTAFSVSGPKATPRVIFPYPVPATHQAAGSHYGLYDGYSYTSPAAGLETPSMVPPVYTGLPYPEPLPTSHTPAMPSIGVTHTPATPTIGSRR